MYLLFQAPGFKGQEKEVVSVSNSSSSLFVLTCRIKTVWYVCISSIDITHRPIIIYWRSIQNRNFIKRKKHRSFIKFWNCYRFTGYFDLFLCIGNILLPIFMRCCFFMLSGGPEQRNFGEAVQDREESHKHQPCPAVRKQGERMTEGKLLKKGKCRAKFLWYLEVFVTYFDTYLEFISISTDYGTHEGYGIPG